MNLIGERYGALVVIGKARNRPPHRVWICKCDCGAKCKKITGYLRRKKSPSGCSHTCPLSRKNIINGSTTHGMSYHRAYEIWHGILNRCFHRSHASWKYYGGRGIKVCKRWQKSFQNFWKDMGPTYRKNLIIDRKNNEGHYTPSNCRWTTHVKNNRNRRGNLTGFPRNFQDIARRHGIKKGCLYRRIKRGMNWKQVISTPLYKQLNLKPRKKYEKRKSA